MLATSYRSAKEKNLFILALIFSAMVWLAVCVSIVGLFYAPFIALGIVVGHAFFLARLTGNAVRVGSRQLPDLYKRVENAASKLGMQEMPEVYVVSGGGILNAFATKLFSRRFVILHSEILDACETLDEGKAPGEPLAVDFIIGHELGHLALGHLSMAWLLAPAHLVPLLGPAYARAKEYSCDRCGLAVVDDADTAARALAVLATGGRQAKKLSMDGLLEQRHETGGLIMALVELNSSHPFLAKRAAAIFRAKDAAIGPDVGRNPLAYVMAPFFGFAAGGVASLAYVYVCVAVIGIMAAVAVPAFEKYEARSKEAALLGMNNDDSFKHHDEPAADLANLFGAQASADQQKALTDALAQLNAANSNDNAVVGGVAGGVGGLGLAAPVVEETPPPPPARFEARKWLKPQIAKKNPEAIAGLETMKAAVIVERLYKAGAPHVFVSDVGTDEQGDFASSVIAELPAKPAIRKKILDVCTAENKRRGLEPCLDDGQPELYLGWQ